MASATSCYETLQAATGKEAIEKAIAAQPSLILLDIRLPEMNGVDAARAIKINARRISRLLVGARILESVGAKKHCEQGWSLTWKSHFQCQ